MPFLLFAPNTLTSPHIHRFELKFESSHDGTVVSVTELSTGNHFQRTIPAEYLLHLTRIQQESLQDSKTSPWLRNVMDCFADELLRVPSVTCPSWRALSLNSLLVRAFHKIPDDDANKIKRFALRFIDLDQENSQVWEGFYFNLDVISPVFDDHWPLSQTVHPGGRDILPGRSNQNETPSPGQDPGVWKHFSSSVWRLTAPLISSSWWANSKTAKAATTGYNHWSSCSNHLWPERGQIRGALLPSRCWIGSRGFPHNANIGITTP